jgi:hypothetical protein
MSAFRTASWPAWLCARGEPALRRLRGRSAARPATALPATISVARAHSLLAEQEGVLLALPVLDELQHRIVLPAVRLPDTPRLDGHRNPANPQSWEG